MGQFSRYAVLVLAVLLGGCQLRLAADVAIDASGGGTLELAVALDEELHELLTEAGFDPAVGFEELASSAPDWEVEQLETDDGLRLRFATSFDDPQDFSRLVEEFAAGGGPGDTELFDELEIALEGDVVMFSGRAGLLLPETAGAEGAGVEFDGDDLERLIDERGDEFVRYELRVLLPASPASHDGDERDGNAVTWRLPVGEMRALEARSEPVRDRTPVIAVAVGLLAVAVGAAAGLWYRRRRGRLTR